MKKQAISPKLNSVFRTYKVQQIKNIIDFEHNSRTHSEEQIDEVVNSINEFGYTNPILVDENNVIIAGHCRVAGAKRCGFDEIPTIIIDGLTDVQKSALVIADNKMALNAGWNYDKLIHQISFLKDNNYDVGFTGFTADEIEAFMPTDVPAFNGDEDEVPDPPAEPITKIGDMWILGDHRLMCGDSILIDDVSKLMNERLADMVFTDPPYGVDYQSNMRMKSPQFETLINDDVVLDISPNVFLILKENGAAFIWTSHTVYPQWRMQFNEYYKNTIIWYKGCGGMGDLSGNYATDYEMALFCVKGKVKFTDARGMAVWDIKKDSNSSYEHPTQKPVALAEKAIKDLTKIGALVVDLFGGSGSTLIACEKTKRKCYMMELMPSYCDVIVARWEKLTGKKAILELNDGTGR